MFASQGVEKILKIISGESNAHFNQLKESISAAKGSMKYLAGVQILQSNH